MHRALSLVLAALLAPFSSAQVQSFDELDWTLTNGSVEGDLLMLEMLGYFNDVSSASTVAPEAGRYTFDVSLGSVGPFGEDSCVTTVLDTNVGCATPETVLTHTLDPSSFHGVWTRTWSVWLEVGECLELRAAEEGFALGCSTKAQFENLQFRPPLLAEPAGVSISAGGAQSLELAAPPQHAGSFYWIFGSASGTEPGLPAGAFTLPLNVDAYFLYTLASPNQPPLSGSLGVLDASSFASAGFSLPPGLSGDLVGLSLHHAFAAFSSSGEALYVGGPARVDFLP
jgi:hypothetical protein